MTLHTTPQNNEVISLERAEALRLEGLHLAEAAVALRSQLMSPIDVNLNKLRAQAAHRHLGFQFAALRALL